MKSDKKEFVARAVIYNVLTVGLAIPLELGMFTFYEYPDETAVQYHLGQGEREAKWDPRYPKWYNYIEFSFEVPERADLPHQWQSVPVAIKLLGKFMAVLQLYSTVPLGARIHAIRPADRLDFTEEDVILFPKDIGGEPHDPEVFFVAKDNVDVLRQHYYALWGKDWQIIQLPIARYMHSFTRDIFSEGFEADDAFLDLMFSLENLCGSPEAISYKIALRASCLLEDSAINRGALNIAQILVSQKKHDRSWKRRQRSGLARG